MFNATLHVDHKTLNIKITMHSWPQLRDRQYWGEVETFYKDKNFSVYRNSSLEIRAHRPTELILWLPGFSDFKSSGPLTASFTAENRTLFNNWIDGYRKAYNNLNGIEPKIWGSFTMETVSVGLVGQPEALDRKPRIG